MSELPLAKRSLACALILGFLMSGCEEGHENSFRDSAPDEMATEVAPSGAAPLSLEDIAEKIAARFISVIKQGPLGFQRPVFLKLHACAKATFEVKDDLREELRVGLFKTTMSKPAWVRFSSDASPMVKDQDNKTLGISIKLMDIPGKKLLPGEEDSPTHDFLLQNHHRFFVDTAKDFMEFTEAIFTQTLPAYLDAHPTTKQILDDMDKFVANVLDIEYWSTTPYRFGDKFVKYKVKPCTDPNDPNYLRTRLQNAMTQTAPQPAPCFEFQVQLQKEGMPLDQATVEWKESESKFETVATIRFEQPQDVAALAATCEHFSWNVFRALPEHEPVGSVNQARGIVYKMSADFRRMKNGKPIVEPTPDPEDGQ
jgi:hypothetical protein